MATVRLQPIRNFKMATVRFSSSSSSCHDHPQHLTQLGPDQQGRRDGAGEGGRTTLFCIAHVALINTPIHDSTTAGGGFSLSYLEVPS